MASNSSSQQSQYAIDDSQFKKILDDYLKRHSNTSAQDNSTTENETLDMGSVVRTIIEFKKADEDEYIVAIMLSFVVIVVSVVVFNLGFKSRRNQDQSQGSRFKFLFLSSLSIQNLMRAMVYLIISISVLAGQSTYDHSLMAIVLLGFPTLCLMSSFSFFIYYVAKLCQLVEKQRLLSENNTDYDDSSQGMRAQDGRYIRVERKVPNLIKPFFLVFNVMAFIAYFAITGFYIRQVQLYAGPNAKLQKFEEPFPNISRKYFSAISGLNGMIFLMLALAILNYGSRLESQIGLSTNYESRKTQSLQGLDMRIFMLTILCSLLFFTIAIVELLCAWGVMTKSEVSFQLLAYYFMTETVPSFVVSKLLSPQVQNLQKKKQLVSNTPNQSRKSSTYGERSFSKFRQSQSDNYLLLESAKIKNENGEGPQYSEDWDKSSEEDSDFGSFNPNLNQRRSLGKKSSTTDEILKVFKSPKRKREL